ncbi:MAG: 4-hydroxythreonine-4-phosphate dehydrogenase PdxA [Dehalococcoidia bacterium]|nr:4-hydroxythreonine-4-phosphate dehydrogenase PdxA [Dehalococcoidia bacterium]
MTSRSGHATADARKADRPLVAITIGDPCGIGPEVVAKALVLREVTDLCRPVVIGSAAVMRDAVRVAKASLAVRTLTQPQAATGEYGVVEVLDLENLAPSAVTVGKLSATAAKAAVEWVLHAGRLCLDGTVKAMATAPINKEAASLAGYKAVGHMELLQEQSGAKNVATMLMTKGLRVVHLTTHRSLRRACDAVTRDNVLGKILLTHQCFQDWGFPSPRIGVAALNPHASDGGLLGTEEAEHIAPAVAEARRQGVDATGPVGADVVYYQAIQGKYDAVLAMYHDQGHVAIKVHGFEESVSLNLGLPFVRTSVDHGTAFDIAGKGVASAVSMTESIRIAAHLALGHRLP